MRQHPRTVGAFAAFAFLAAAGIAQPVAVAQTSGIAQPAPDQDLQIFRAWLDREHKGYGCDEGPARFQNKTVDAAYPCQRLYYVLTYVRGIQPPYER